VKVVFIFLALSLGAQALPGDPGSAALDFLEKVRQRKVDLEPGGDTALFQGTAEEKRREISRRLDRMARDLGSDSLELGAVRQDADYAAVLVRKTGGFDPSRLQIFPVALVKRGAEWLAAPVPASFENAGAGHGMDLRKRVEALETWMLKEQVVDLEKLRALSAEKMRQRIETKLTAAELKKMNVRGVGEKFLSACGNKDVATVLGLLGGLAAEQPEDWAARVKAADEALKGEADAGSPWHLFTAPGVARVAVRIEEGAGNGLVTIASLDPAAKREQSTAPRIVVTDLNLTKTREGLWQVNLPTEFLYPSDEPAEDAEPEVADRFSEKWRENHPSVSQPTAAAAHEALAKTLAGDNLGTLLDGIITAKDATQGRANSLRAAQIWWKVHGPAMANQPMSLDLTADETTAVGFFQNFSVRDADRWDPLVVYYEKTEAGWWWTPYPKVETLEKHKEWVDAATRRLPEEWQQTVFSKIPLLPEIGTQSPVTKEEAEKFMQAWFDTLQRADMTAAQGFIAKLGGAKSGETALKNLRYEISNARKGSAKPAIVGIYEGRTWTAVGVRSEQSGKPNYPLYPLVKTPQGVRILIETDLFASTKRRRDFLNEAALEGVAKSSTPAAADELRELLSKFQKDVTERGE
jgi:hypothetical protein